jgi:glutamate/tyrosine decarboxylase-like PLP-dependent enzyme
MASFAERGGLWFHVDAAYGGFAILAPGERDTFQGLERADSVTLDPHKWFFQPYETGCLMVRDTRILETAFRILPEYLQDVALGREQVNFADRGLQLTRGFRALKVWMSVQTLGLGAFRGAVEAGIDHAKRAAEYVSTSSSLEMTGPPSLGMVCFRFRPVEGFWSDEELEALNTSIQEEIVDSGKAMMSSTRLKGVYSLRLAILNYRSTWEDVLVTLREVERIGQVVAARRAEP